MEITPKTGKFAPTASSRNSDRTGFSFQLNLNPFLSEGSVTKIFKF